MANVRLRPVSFWVALSSERARRSRPTGKSDPELPFIRDASGGGFYRIRTVQELLGHRYVKADRGMYAILNRGRRGNLLKICTGIDEGGNEHSSGFSRRDRFLEKAGD